MIHLFVLLCINMQPCVTLPFCEDYIIFDYEINRKSIKLIILSLTKYMKNVIRLILKLRVILWLGIMIMCLGEMTCLHTDYCFSELVQNIQLNVGLLQSGVIRKNSHHISKENSHLVVSNNRDSLI